MSSGKPAYSSRKQSALSGPRGLLAWLVLTAGVATVGVAQYQVNTQIYGNSGSSVRYARSYQPNYAQHPTYNLLPSENRNLVYRSGALPSTLRMNYASIGPMAPQGVTAYVPDPVSFRGSGITQGNYVNTVAPARIAPMPTMPVPAAIGNPVAMGSMRYAMPAAGSPPMTGFSVGTAPVMPAQGGFTPVASPTPLSGSVRYSWKLSE
jgi:hypothetical protein